MAKYSDASRWSLTFNYNTIRGRILDGELVSPKPSVNWQRGKHSLEDDSCAYSMIKYFETRPNRTASIEDIITSPILAKYTLESLKSNGERLIAHMLRELNEQGIVTRI